MAETLAANLDATRSRPCCMKDSRAVAQVAGWWPARSAALKIRADRDMSVRFRWTPQPALKRARQSLLDF